MHKITQTNLEYFYMEMERGNKKGKKFVRLLICILFSSIFHIFSLINQCNAQWQQITLPVTGSVYQMQFVNHNIGWASIYHGYDDFYLIKTTDSGSNWNIIFHDSAKVQNFQFIDDTLGYARGVGYLTHYMLKTTNGGYNWIIMQDSPGYVFSGFYMVGADTGYVDVWYFNPPYSNEFTFRTVNGFHTLETVSTGTGGVPSTMYFLKEKYNGKYCGFIHTSSYFSKTTNSGFNWQIINFAESGYVVSFSFLNKDTGWVVYNPTLGNISQILYTSNSGQNWTTQYISSMQNDFGYIQVIDENKIWCGKVYDNRVLITTNGGNIWGYQTSQIYTNGGIYIVDTNLGFSWSDYQVTRTINGGGQILSVEKISNNAPNTVELKQNYPNPFNSESKIKYKVAKAADIKLMVFNILGKEIKTLANKKHSTGIYEVKFNGYNLPSGIYFYSLFVDGVRVETKKMVVMK